MTASTSSLASRGPLATRTCIFFIESFSTCEYLRGFGDKEGPIGVQDGESDSTRCGTCDRRKKYLSDFRESTKKVLRERHEDQRTLDSPALSPADFDHPETVVRTNLAQNSVYVVFHRLLSKVQVCSDLLIRKPLSNHGNQLLFPSGESQPSFRMAVRGSVQVLSHVAEQEPAKPRRAYDFVLGHRPYCSKDIRSRGCFGHVSDDTCPDS